MQQIVEIAAVLSEDGTVEFVFGQQLFLDGLGNFPLGVKRSSRREADEKKGDGDHAEEHHGQGCKSANHSLRLKTEGRRLKQKKCRNSDELRTPVVLTYDFSTHPPPSFPFTSVGLA